MRSILIVALFSLMKTPLLICLNRNNWRTLRTFGATLLILETRKKGKVKQQSNHKFNCVANITSKLK